MTALRCANHPDVETYLRCSRCEKPICARCAVQTPVGARCRECANLKKAPMFQVGAALFARAAVLGLVVALAGGFLLAEVDGAFGLYSLLLLLLGFGVGEAVSRGARRRYSTGLVVLAGALTVFGAVAGRALVILLRLPPGLAVGPKLEAVAAFAFGGTVGSLFGLLFLVLAVVVATSRVR